MRIGAVVEELILTDRHRARVNILLRGVLPHELLVGDVPCSQCVAEAPGNTWPAVITFAQVAPAPAAEGSIALRGLSARILAAGEHVHHAVDQHHPLPLARHARNADRAGLVAGLRIDQQTPRAFHHVEVLARRDERRAVHHVTVGQLAFPQHGAVVAVASDDAVHPIPLAAMVSDVTDGQKRAAGGGGCDRRHGDVIGLRHELRHVRSLDDGVFGNRIVVRAVLPVAPVAGTLERRLDDFGERALMS